MLSAGSYATLSEEWTGMLLQKTSFLRPQKWIFNLGRMNSLIICTAVQY